MEREINDSLPAASCLDVQHDDQFVQLGVITGGGRNAMNFQQLLDGQNVTFASTPGWKLRRRRWITGGIDELVTLGVLVEAPQRRQQILRSCMSATRIGATMRTNLMRIHQFFYLPGGRLAQLPVTPLLTNRTR
ncbi:hypothetical protein [Nocardia sp. NPDC057440]|uniref:hypothetical protein n=1 Tax=Nocardia sp. NPDC057440 TaxID=3346134 RepID=UPI00366DCC0F